MIFLSLHLGKQQARDMIHSTSSDIFDTSLNKIFVHDLSFSLISNISNFLEKNQIIIINKSFSFFCCWYMLIFQFLRLFKHFCNEKFKNFCLINSMYPIRYLPGFDLYPSVSIRCHSWNKPRNLSHTVTKNRFSQ